MCPEKIAVILMQKQEYFHLTHDLINFAQFNREITTDNTCLNLEWISQKTFPIIVYNLIMRLFGHFFFLLILL